MIRQVKYKGEVIDIAAVEVVWTDRFGKKHIGSIEDYAYDFAEEEVSIVVSGEYW